MSIRTSLSIVEPCNSDGSIRLHVVSAAPDSKDHAMCRQFYRDADAANADRDDYRPYSGWLPMETAESLRIKRSEYAEDRYNEEQFMQRVGASLANIPIAEATYEDACDERSYGDPHIDIDEDENQTGSYA